MNSLKKSKFKVLSVDLKGCLQNIEKISDKYERWFERWNLKKTKNIWTLKPKK